MCCRESQEFVGIFVGGRGFCARHPRQEHVRHRTEGLVPDRDVPKERLTITTAIDPPLPPRLTPLPNVPTISTTITPDPTTTERHPCRQHRDDLPCRDVVWPSAVRNVMLCHVMFGLRCRDDEMISQWHG